MRTDFRVAQESANGVCHLRRYNMLKLAGVFVQLAFAYHKHIGEQALGEAVAARDIHGQLLPFRGKLNGVSGNFYIAAFRELTGYALVCAFIQNFIYRLKIVVPPLAEMPYYPERLFNVIHFFCFHKTSGCMTGFTAKPTTIPL